MRPSDLALTSTLLLACATPRGADRRHVALSSAGGDGVDASAQSLSNEPDASAPAPRGPVRLVALERRAAPAEAPAVAIRSPAAGATIREGRAEVRLDVARWRDPTRADDLRHVCVTLDAEPCLRVDDPSRPVVLQNLAEGTHVVRAFAVWETHESLSTRGAIAQSVLNVGRATPAAELDPAGPALVLHRPDGELTGEEAERVRVDFILANVPDERLGAEGMRVRLHLDDVALPDITNPTPHALEGVGDGVHALRAELIGPDGAALRSPLARAERRFIVRRGARR